MINNILQSHKKMLFAFLDATDMDEYGLAWFFKRCIIYCTISMVILINDKLVI